MRWCKLFLYLFLLMGLALPVSAADEAINTRTELAAAPAENDVLAIYDQTASAGRRITVLNLMGSLEAALTTFAIHVDNLPSTAMLDSEWTAATTDAAGKSELAIITEVNNGTDTGRTITPDALAGSDLGTKDVCLNMVDSDTAVAVADGVIAYTVPASMNSMDLINVVCSVEDKGVTATTDVQIRRRRAGANKDMLSTKITLGDEWFATDESVNATNDDVNTGDQIYADIDTIHSGTAPNGLSCVLEFRLP